MGRFETGHFSSPNAAPQALSPCSFLSTTPNLFIPPRLTPKNTRPWDRKRQQSLPCSKKETKAVRKEAQRRRIGIQSAKTHLSQESKPTQSDPDTESVKTRKAVAPKRVVRTFEIDDMQEDDS